jgi:hypothetical protein
MAIVPGRGEVMAAKAALRGEDINETRQWIRTSLFDFHLLEFRKGGSEGSPFLSDSSFLMWQSR